MVCFINVFYSTDKRQLFVLQFSHFKLNYLNFKFNHPKNQFIWFECLVTCSATAQRRIFDVKTSTKTWTRAPWNKTQTNPAKTQKLHNNNKTHSRITCVPLNPFEQRSFDFGKPTPTQTHRHRDTSLFSRSVRGQKQIRNPDQNPAFDRRRLTTVPLRVHNAMLTRACEFFRFRDDARTQATSRDARARLIAVCTSRSPRGAPPRAPRPLWVLVMVWIRVGFYLFSVIWGVFLSDSDIECRSRKVVDFFCF